MSEDTGYRPVDCDFHDRLEEFATLRRRVRIAFDPGGAPGKPVEGRIRDLYTTDRKEEYLLMEDGTTIRLDRIRSIDAA